MRGAWWCIDIMVDNAAVTNSRMWRKFIDRKSLEAAQTSGFQDTVFTVEERERNTVLQDLGVNFE